MVACEHISPLCNYIYGKYAADTLVSSIYNYGFIICLSIDSKKKNTLTKIDKI